MLENPTMNAIQSAGDITSSSSFQTFLGGAFIFGMLIYWTGAFFILYHLIRFGVGNQPKKIALLFLAGSLVLSIITTLFLYQAII